MGDNVGKSREGNKGNSLNVVMDFSQKNDNFFVLYS